MEEEEEEARFSIFACRRHSYTAPSMPAETRLRSSVDQQMLLTMAVCEMSTPVCVLV